MRYVLKEYDLNVKYGNTIKQVRTVGIGKKNEETGIIYPTPLTNYIKQRYRRKSKSLNYQKNAAYSVCKFLNYCLERIEEDEFKALKTDGIKKLNLKHGSEYISSLTLKVLSNELSPQYIKSEVKYINNFYDWLNESNILEEKITVLYEEKQIQKQNTKSSKKIIKRLDLFDNDELGTMLPNFKDKASNKLVDFGKDRKKLSEHFLNVVKNNSPEIYLGVCLQFYGGLRVGEIVNLDDSSIKLKDENYIIQVRDRSDILFDNKKTKLREQVKVERNQAVFFKEKIKNAIEINKKLNLKNNKGKSLLKNTKDGKAITGNMYRNKFNKCKKIFIEELLFNNDHKNYNVLSVYPWSTHIGRGIFTNLCLDAKMDITQVAIARGDSNISTVMKYVDKRTVQQTLSETIYEMLGEEKDEN